METKVLESKEFLLSCVVVNRAVSQGVTTTTTLIIETE